LQRATFQRRRERVKEEPEENLITKMLKERELGGDVNTQYQ
jgi:hypothetical protein